MAIDPYDVLGTWQISRRLMDRAGRQFGRMQGELIVSADADGIRWDERGQLTWAGQSITATRNLAARRFDGEWWMTFVDGTRFHPWRPGYWVEHPCRADVYRGRLDIDSGLTSMSLLWDVTGPNKAQRLFTRFRRLLTSESSASG